MHVFLSPHLDDVPLSCGGLVHRLTHSGETVIILTAMAGDPPTPLPQSPLIEELHQRWQLGDNPIVGRRAEDECAAQRLGARAMHLPIPDCIYRTAGTKALYTDETAIFGNISPADRAHWDLLSAPLPAEDVISCLYAPLGVGHHVDHQIIRDWGLALADTHPNLPVYFYEEYPYNHEDEAIEAALNFHTNTMSPEIIMIDDEELEAKLEAIACYQSQISTFWSSITELRHDLIHTMQQIGNGQPAERYWRIVDNDH